MVSIWIYPGKVILGHFLILFLVPLPCFFFFGLWSNKFFLLMILPMVVSLMVLMERVRERASTRGLICVLLILMSISHRQTLISSTSRRSVSIRRTLIGLVEPGTRLLSRSPLSLNSALQRK